SPTSCDYHTGSGVRRQERDAGQPSAAQREPARNVAFAHVHDLALAPAGDCEARARLPVVPAWVPTPVRHGGDLALPHARRQALFVAASFNLAVDCARVRAYGRWRP